MRIYRGETIELPTDQNLTELLHTTARPLPDSHLVAKDSLTNRSITIGELRERAGRIAKGLSDEYRPREGAHWAIIMPNSVDYIEVFHSVLWTGGVACPINHALKATEIGHGLAVSLPEYIVCYGAIVPAVLEAIEVAAAETAAKKTAWSRPHIITVVERAPGYKHIPDDLFARSKLAIPHWNDTRDKLATIHLSSGTTGQPKGVELTHYNFVSMCRQLFAHDPAHFHAGSRGVAFTPFAHIANTTIPLFLSPWTGMMHHAMPRYDFEEFGRLAGSLQSTTFQGVPSVVLAMANSDIAVRNDFSRASVIEVGGAPLKEAVLKKLYSRAPWKLNQLYGMTEAAGYVAFQKVGEEIPLGSAGKLLPGIEAMLKKEGTTEDVPVGQPGELWLRGPNMTRGYAFNPNATGSAFPIEGWYNTGDVCTIDAQGYVSVVGRTKELIKYKGFQVAPAELESYLNVHPALVEGGVGAIWDESQLTELPAAWVILKEEVACLSDKERRKVLREVQQAIDSQVSGYKKLRGGVWQVDRLPKNPTGKILRKQMVAMRSGLCSLDKPILARL